MRLATIHQTLAEVRRERGLSQMDLAEALNVEQAAISMYENGKRGIPLALLDDWLAVLDIGITITPKGHEPVQAPDIVQRELEEFQELKRHRNYCIAEMRSMMARRVMSESAFQDADEESGESRFWAYSFHDENVIGVVESRTDHPHAKHLAVEYTDEEVNVYRLAANGSNKALGRDRAYMTEDDFLRLGAALDYEEMAAAKSTIFRTNAGRPDGVELVSPEGFPVRSLLDMQETLEHFSSIYDEVIGQDDYQKLEEELLCIERRLDEILIDNRLENGMPNPEFARWTEDDEQAVSVPLYSAERIWRWVEEGVSWADDCHQEVEQYDKIVESALELDDPKEQ